MRQKIMLKCTVCNERNYILSKNKKGEAKIKIKKYCPTCQKQTLHEEISKLK